MSVDARLAGAVEAWLAADPDPETRAELTDLVRAAADGDAAAGADLAARFSGRLAFGTAGLRAEMGAGPMRMNRLVVRWAAAGLARHLGAGSTVVIAHDARHRSDRFALDSARVLAAAGCRVLRVPDPAPTPVLAFAVRHLGADAGIMCTASHNPPRDNGYKVYLGDGAQIVPPVDAEIAAAIDAVASSGAPVLLAEPDDPAVVALGAEIVDAYVRHALAAVPGGPGGSGAAAESPRSIVYTPLHGVGRTVARAVLGGGGFRRVHEVRAQAEPDGDFPTVAFPNPEEPGALDLALADASRIGADVVLANDPDADRLGVAVPDGAAPGGWRALTGNEIGAVLAEHVLQTTSGADRLVVTTFVSSRLLARQAAHHGVHHAEVLTGFKWIVRPGMQRPDLRFVFGFEEALGYSVDAYVRDKDGITAALAFARALDRLAAEGRDVDAELEALARRHGHHATRTWSVRLEGPDAAARMAAVVDRWRLHPPSTLAGTPVVSAVDLAAPGGPLPPTDAVALDLADGGRALLRPSGTEPKVKVYLEVVVAVADGPRGYAAARAAGEERLEALRLAVADSLDLPAR